MADEVVAPQKRCTKCGENRPATLEIFYPCRRTRCGLSGCCRDCNKKASAARYVRIKLDPELLEAERERCRRKGRVRYAAEAARRAAEREIRSRIECAACAKPIIATKHSQKFCQECRPLKYAEWKRSWSDANRASLLVGKKAWYRANRDRLLESGAKYREQNRLRLRAYFAERYLRARDTVLARNKTPEGRERQRRRCQNPKVRVSMSMSGHIRYCIGRRKNGARWESLAGYDLATLMRHLERQFVRGMTWNNYGPVWHIDHIQPLSSFRFESAEDPEFRAAWALSNLRPLWALDNIRKNGRRLFLL